MNRFFLLNAARAAGVALFAAAGLAMAQPVGGPPAGAGPMTGHGGERMMGRQHPGPGMQGRFGPGRAMAALNLTEDQRTQVGKIREDSRKDTWNTAGQLMSERFALRELMRADRIDSNAVVQQQAKVDELERQILKSRLDARNRIAQLLTPEQQKIFRSMPMRGPGERGRGMRGGMMS